MLFLVTQVPKWKYASIYSSTVGVFEAKTAAEAIRLALATDDPDASGDKFVRHADFKRPVRCAACRRQGRF